MGWHLTLEASCYVTKITTARLREHNGFIKRDRRMHSREHAIATIGFDSMHWRDPSDKSFPRLHISPRRSIISSIAIFHFGIAWRTTYPVRIRAARHVTMPRQVMCSSFSQSPSDGDGYRSMCGAGSVDFLTSTYRTLYLLTLEKTPDHAWHIALAVTGLYVGCTWQ